MWIFNKKSLQNNTYLYLYYYHCYNALPLHLLILVIESTRVK